MARDPWAGYDSWLERPYQDDAKRQEELEWIDEHSTFETQCCGVDVTEVEDIREWWAKQQEAEKKHKSIEAWSDEERKSLIQCPECKEFYLVNKIEPEIPEYDGPEYEPPDELDDDPRNDFLNI